MSSLSFQEIVDGAREATGGLPDPDSDSWREGLEILLADHAAEQCLSERGWQILRSRYVSALASRMRVDAYLRDNPQILKAPVVAPIVILGLVRTGTTLVSYLMNENPQHRSLLRWEPYNAVPPAAPGALTTDARCIAEKANDQRMIEGNPEGVKTHFEPADGPTECVHLLAQDFRSMMFMALTATPRYADWIMQCDMRSAYEHRKRVLQILQSTNSGTWVLKMPSDAVFIDALVETFPDARLIWTHRDPVTAFASSMNMRGTSTRIFNQDIPRDYMAEKFPAQLAAHVLRPLRFAQQHPDRLYHLYYKEVMRDPIAAMQATYAWLGEDWLPATETGMQRWLAENPQNKFGRHEYALEDWGLTAPQVTESVADYLAVHGTRL